MPTCEFDVFNGTYDADWAAALAKPIIAQHVIVVCFDPNGMSLQLTGRLAEMRPITQERDVKFQEYQGQDIDLEFIDPDGELDPAVSTSVLYGQTWRGRKVLIGSWLDGTQRVLQHGIFYLDDIRAAKGVIRFRCLDAFSRLSSFKVRANLGINPVFTSASGTGRLLNAGVFPHSADMEHWTITFTTPTHFLLRGSITGDDGEGETTAQFTSTSGAIQIQPSDWQGTWAAGDTVTFDSVARYPLTGQGNLFAVARQMLVDNSGLTEDDFDDASWDQAEADFSSHTIQFTQREPIDALSLLRIFMRHGPVTAYPDHEGKIAIGYFIPRLAPSISATICATYDLEDLDTERLDNYDSIVINYAPEEWQGTVGNPGPATDGALQRSLKWPLEGTGNKVLTIELRGFGEDDESIVYSIAQRYYAQFQVQREVLNVDLHLHDLNRKLEDVAYVRSSYPLRTTYGQFIRLDKDLSRRQIRAKLLDVGYLVQADGTCGAMFYDSGHTYDDCWYFW